MWSLCQKDHGGERWREIVQSHSGEVHRLRNRGRLQLRYFFHRLATKTQKHESISPFIDIEFA